MVVYDLICTNYHVFEGWFKSSDDFDSQNAVGMLACPVCGSTNVSKKISAPNIIKRQASSSKGKEESAEVSVDELNEKTNSKAPSLSSPNSESSIRFTTAPEQLEMLREFVEKNFEDVGEDFSEESRRMHYGETQERAIRGQASPEDIVELEEEGITTYTVPSSIPKKKLN